MLDCRQRTECCGVVRAKNRVEIQLQIQEFLRFNHRFVQKRRAEYRKQNMVIKRLGIERIQKALKARARRFDVFVVEHHDFRTLSIAH